MKHTTPRLTALAVALVSVCAHAQSNPQYEYRALKKGLAVSATPSAPGATYLAQASANKLTFSAVEVGQSNTQQVLLSNIGTGTLTLSAPTVSGSGFASSTACGATLAAGASCLVDVTFSPTQAGSASGSLNLVSNAQGSPIVVTLSGNAVQAEGSLVAATSADFGSVQVGGSVSRQFTFTNTGTSAATGVRAVLNPASGLSFTVNNCGTQASPVTVDAGQSCSMTVSWAPSSSGALSASLSVESSAANSPNALSLSGTATVPVDASFANVGILLGGDALPLTDSSSNAFSVSNTNVSLTTGRFGSGAMSFDGGTTLLTLPGSTLWSQVGAYTLEAWVNLPNNGGGGWLWSRVTPNYLNLIVNSNGSVDIDKSSVGIQRSFAAGTIPTNTWAHIAMTSDGTTVRFFVNGVLKGSFAAGSQSNGGGGSIVIGRYANGNGWFKGAVDELRWTSGVARYTADFTPPTAAFPRQ